MDSTYQAISQFAQTWGLLYLMLLMGLVVVYALWPSNRDKFDRAARAPLDDDAATPPDEGKH